MYKYQKIMTTQEIANKLYEFCKIGQNEEAQNELYAENATSTEINMQWERETINWIDAIKAKGAGFYSMIEEMHDSYTNEPKVFGQYIFMEMGMDATMKNIWKMKMDEMCKYEVKDGKIISEEFFY